MVILPFVFVYYWGFGGMRIAVPSKVPFIGTAHAWSYPHIFDKVGNNSQGQTLLVICLEYQ
jgi:hypothetical protein